MTKLLLVGTLLFILLPETVAAQVNTIKGPGGKVCDRTNSCACKPTLKACVACNTSYGVEEQTRWCKINNPAYGS